MVLQASMRKSVRGAVILGCLLLASACPAENQSPDAVTLTPADKFSHSATDFMFPEWVAEFQRVEVTQYDEAGRDIGVGYNLYSPDLITATVYVYPGRDVLNLGSDSDVVSAAKGFLDQQEFEAAKDAILATTPGLTLVFEDDSFVICSPSEQVGRRAIFQGQGLIDGVPTILRTEVNLFGFDDWFIKYRFTYPGESAPAPALILDFMNSLEWPADEDSICTPR